MAVTVDWANKIINVPISYMTLIQSVPTEIRQLDLNQIRLDLKGLEATDAGMSFPRTHNHTAPITVGGVQLARVFEIINGYTVSFEDGQYAVNLLGANTNLGDVTNVNQVSVRSSNSAGLVNIDEFKLQSFQNARIWINTTVGIGGTTFPLGTASSPVDNPTDALFIASQYDLERFHLSGVITLPNGEEFAGSAWEGHSIVSSMINLNNVSINGSFFKNIEVQGQCNGYIDLEQCKLGTITNFKGVIQNSTFDNITIDATNTDLIHLSSIYSHSTSLSLMDINGADCNVMIKDFFGGMSLENNTQDNIINIDASSGKIHIKNTCTAGTIVVSGICELIDESGPLCDVKTSGNVNIKAMTKNQFLALK
jgi:hypothetical protein